MGGSIFVGEELRTIHQTQNLHLSSFLRWAGCGRSTAAWSLLSRPFWWKVVTSSVGGGGQLLMLKQASVFHVVLALSNMDERMQHKAGAGAVCQLHDTNHGRHLGRTCTARSVRGFGYLVMHDMNRGRALGSHFW